MYLKCLTLTDTCVYFKYHLYWRSYDLNYLQPHLHVSLKLHVIGTNVQLSLVNLQILL